MIVARGMGRGAVLGSIVAVGLGLHGTVLPPVVVPAPGGAFHWGGMRYRDSVEYSLREAGDEADEEMVVLTLLAVIDGYCR